MDPVERFWAEWFGPFKREVLLFTADGNPYRAFLNSHEQLKNIVEKHHAQKHPIYLSVQPYETLDKPSHLEKLFFEFDDKKQPEKAVEDALKFAKTLNYFYRVRPFTCLSGGKGAHVYLFLKEPIEINGLEEKAKQTYRSLQEKLLMGLKLPTLDNHVVGNIKQLARLPYTKHEKTSNICQPVDLNGNPINPEDFNIKTFRAEGLNINMVEKASHEILNEEKPRTKPISSLKGLRPEVRELIERAKKGVDLTHEQRLAILFEMINRGYGDDDIHNVFINQPDYNAGKTQYFIDHARRRYYKPFSKERLLNILKGRGMM